MFLLNLSINRMNIFTFLILTLTTNSIAKLFINEVLVKKFACFIRFQKEFQLVITIDNDLCYFIKMNLKGKDADKFILEKLFLVN